MKDQDLSLDEALASFDTPAWMAEQCREQQAATPYFGLGFSKSTIPSEHHSRIVDETRLQIDRFLPAASKEEIRSIDASVIPSLRLAGQVLDQEILTALDAISEAWAGMRLQRAPGGGLRAFQRGSYVLGHTDRASGRIISCSLCLAQELDAPWPLRIEDIEGRAHKVELAPGELLLYESARLIHGRPWPLEGEYYLSWSAHYRPVGLGGTALDS